MTAAEPTLFDEPVPPEVAALAETLTDLVRRLPSLDGGGVVTVGAGSARYVLDRLREEHGLRLAPIEKPPTSLQLAAGEVENLVPRHRAVYDVLVRYGPQADHDLTALYEALVAGDGGRSEVGWEIPAQTPASIRSRRVELVRAGLVEDSGLVSETPAGGRAKVWRIVRPTVEP